MTRMNRRWSVPRLGGPPRNRVGNLEGYNHQGGRVRVEPWLGIIPGPEDNLRGARNRDYIFPNRIFEWLRKSTIVYTDLFCRIERKRINSL